MHADAADMTADNAPDTATKGGRKVRLLTIDDLDGRTRAAQRVRETRSEVLSDLGGEEHLSTLERIAVDNVAMIDAMLKDASARWLLGDPLDVAVIGTLQNTFNRTATTLGWQRRSRDVTPDLNTYMAQKAAEKAREAAQ